MIGGYLALFVALAVAEWSHVSATLSSCSSNTVHCQSSECQWRGATSGPQCESSDLQDIATEDTVKLTYLLRLLEDGSIGTTMKLYYQELFARMNDLKMDSVQIEANPWQKTNERKTFAWNETMLRITLREAGKTLAFISVPSACQLGVVLSSFQVSTFYRGSLGCDSHELDQKLLCKKGDVKCADLPYEEQSKNPHWTMTTFIDKGEPPRLLWSWSKNKGPEEESIRFTATVGGLKFAWFGGAANEFKYLFVLTMRKQFAAAMGVALDQVTWFHDSSSRVDSGRVCGGCAKSTAFGAGTLQWIWRVELNVKGTRGQSFSSVKVPSNTSLVAAVSSLAGLNEAKDGNQELTATQAWAVKFRKSVSAAMLVEPKIVEVTKAMLENIPDTMVSTTPTPKTAWVTNGCPSHHTAMMSCWEAVQAKTLCADAQAKAVCARANPCYGMNNDLGTDSWKEMCVAGKFIPREDPGCKVPCSLPADAVKKGSRPTASNAASGLRPLVLELAASLVLIAIATPI